MKAAVYYETGAPEVLRYEDVPDPVASPGSVLIEIGAISVEGGDTLNRAGGEMATNPHIVGYQCAGTIIEVGEGVTDRFVGQRVVATGLWGSHAAMIAAPSVITWVIPEHADLVKCACVPVAFGTADDCLFEFGHLKSGETVLVQAGASGVGVAAIQLAKRAGARVIATASSDARLEQLKPLGMDVGVNYRTHNVPDEVMRITDKKGVNLVVDPVGGSTLQGSLLSLGYRGRCSMVGAAGREPMTIDVSSLMGGNRTLQGVC